MLGKSRWRRSHFRERGTVRAIGHRAGIGSIVRRSPSRGARSSSLPLACRPRIEQTGYRIRGLGRSVAPDCRSYPDASDADPSFASAGLSASADGPK
jgi:hypothetical protein